MRKSQPVIAILGPTAVGKTRISIPLAKQFEGEIVSVDSRLIYRGMDVGTAKPTFKEREQVPHHLIDVANPDDTWNLAKFCEAALNVIHDIHSKGKVAFLVGGTGQYLRAILEGWTPPPSAESTDFRETLEATAARRGYEVVHRQLQDVDPASASRIDPRNVRRVIRALEIFHLTGMPASSQRVKKPPSFEILRIGLTLPRAELYQRIDQRIDLMIEEGWIEEVQELIDSGISPDLPSLSAIGYAQLAAHLSGEMDLDSAIVEIRRLSRQFVRRQANWFKADDPEIQWFDAVSGVEERITAVIEHWLYNED
ncbi:MAG: tRNA (adenosine(37)-N6)-dimethylallyltransferase MiaA [Anaerolineales bacterium]|nr:MAG: tRNA (adenosine(37)-N6)-dimethylallyltransferase MiaA [Anaerolineales bacterium]